MIKFEDKHASWAFLIILILTVGLITYVRVKMHFYLWPAYDTFDLLANAALFAGKGIGYSDLIRPPLLPFLTSIYFMFDGLNMGVISVIDGILYILGCIGLYLFLKERFTALVSFLGGLLYATSPLILIFAAVGYNDIPSVSIGIWAIYFTYMGVKRNSKFFYLAFPVAMLAVLTKYNMALLIFPMFTYIFMSRDEIKNTKDIIWGICLGALVLAPVLLFFNAKLGNPIYPFMDFLKTSGSSFSSEHFAYNPDLLYFVKNLPHYLGIPSLLIVFSTLFALLFNSYKKIGTLSWNHIMTKNNIQVLILLLILTILISTFGKLHYLVSEVLFVAVILLIYKISVERNWDFGMDLVFLSWFATFFIFHSAYMNKDHRYFIFMAAPIAYLLLRGLTFFTETFQVNFKKKNITLYIFSALLILLMVSSTISRFDAIEKANIDNKEFNEDIFDACNWLKNYDPDYKSKVIYADSWAIFAWHLQMDVGKMPTFRNNQTILLGAKNTNFNKEDEKAYNRELSKKNPDYYFFTWGKMNFTNYEAIKSFGPVTIYKKK